MIFRDLDFSLVQTPSLVFMFTGPSVVQKQDLLKQWKFKKNFWILTVCFFFFKGDRFI